MGLLFLYGQAILAKWYLVVTGRRAACNRPVRPTRVHAGQELHGPGSKHGPINIAHLHLFIDFLDNVWIPRHAENYLRTRDPAALPYLPLLLPAPAKAKAVPLKKAG